MNHSQSQQAIDLALEEKDDLGVGYIDILSDGLAIAICPGPQDRPRGTAIEIAMLVVVQRHQELFAQVLLALCQKMKQGSEAFLKRGVRLHLSSGLKEGLLGYL